MTKKIIVEISDELDKDFRKTIIQVYGFKQGNLKKAIIEALQMWIDKQKWRKHLASR